MSSDPKSQMRRRSMQGIVLLALGIVAAIAFVPTGAVWLVAVAAVFLVVGVWMLYQVGKSLS